MDSFIYYVAIRTVKFTRVKPSRWTSKSFKGIRKSEGYFADC